MRLLHGTNEDIVSVNLSICGPHNDFGRGFYLTPSWQRAWEMGRRRKNSKGGEIVVNAFSFSPEEAHKRGLKVLHFKSFSVDWARFVIKNRESKNSVHDYDIVIGPVADAVFDRVLAQYKSEAGEDYLSDTHLSSFIGRVSQFGINYIQYCFCTEASLKVLHKEK